MKSVGSDEARTHFSRLLGRAEKGESITITRRGRPIARLIPAPPREGVDVHRVIAAFQAYSRRQGRTLGGLSTREAIDEDRR